MKFSKKVLGIAMGIVMLGSQAMFALAATEPADGTTDGTANILDYKVETVVVPTTLKITLNPKGYDITTKYVEATSHENDTVYYTVSSGAYVKADPQPTPANFGTGGPYYKAVVSTDQVVSLNYGIASKSTGVKNVKVNFVVDYTADTTAGKKAIVFVDSEAKAQAYDATNNAVGAKKGEHKIYLAVASAKVSTGSSPAVTANTYVKTAETSTSGSTKTFYTKDNNGVYTKVITPADADLGTYYEATTTIGTEITAAELSDVIMEKATAGNQAFTKKTGATNKADASIAYKLPAATYALKEGEKIDFSTTQSQLGSKLEMSVIGGVAGFTLTGAVNADADWTEADAAAITITPTYTITDATGAETDVTGAYNQVTPGPSLTTTAYTINASNSPITVTVSDLGSETISSVIANGNANLGDSGAATISGATVTITSAWLGSFYSGDSASIKITTSGGTELTFTVTK